MEAIASIFAKIIQSGITGKTPEEQRNWTERLKKVYMETISKTPEERLQNQVDDFNRMKYEPAFDKNLRDTDEYKREEHFASVVHCEKCGNKAEIAFAKDGNFTVTNCECATKRLNIIRLENSGLIDLIGEYTFEKYQALDGFNRKIKQKALDFVDKSTNDFVKKWFFIGGQVGCGKTHICTAIVGELINRNFSAKYMMYRDEAVYLKSIVAKEPEEYAKKIEFLKSVDVLYIDDLFKTKNAKEYEKEKPMPTAGDINLVFEIINARYNNKSKITVISSEKDIDEIIDIDEGIGSRINQRSAGFVTNVGTDKNKNWRLRGV